MSSLQKVLNTRGLTLIVVGSCIGSGIFVTPATTMQHLPHHGYALLTWAIGGIVALLGAMTFSELGSRYPREGGVYVYLREAYGPLAGFLYGWIILFIVTTGALAALCLVLIDYLSILFPKLLDYKSLLAILILWILTIVNIFGTNISQTLASAFSTLKLAAMVAVVIIGIMYLPEMNHSIKLDLTKNIPDNLFKGVLMAFVGVFWSMGGWHHATYLSGETINPTKTVPKAMFYGTTIVTVIYLLIIIAYMVLLPIEQMANSQRLAGDAVSQYISWGGKAVALAISISIMGSVAIYTMSAPRIYFAMAKDKVFFNSLADVSSKYGTPYKAMLFQTMWATVLILAWGAFDKLATFVTFMDIVFMALATATIFVFRSRNNEKASYSVKPYPLVPLAYLLITILFVLNTLIEIKTESWSGMAILLAGVPAFYLFKKYSN
jgi:APA family basic amino acid/polyamine antiporter